MTLPLILILFPWSLAVLNLCNKYMYLTNNILLVTPNLVSLRKFRRKFNMWQDADSFFFLHALIFEIWQNNIQSIFILKMFCINRNNLAVRYDLKSDVLHILLSQDSGKKNRYTIAYLKVNAYFVMIEFNSRSYKHTFSFVFESSAQSGHINCKWPKSIIQLAATVHLVMSCKQLIFTSPTKKKYATLPTIQKTHTSILSVSPTTIFNTIYIDMVRNGALLLCSRKTIS